jgi:hypothetical protein
MKWQPISTAPHETPVLLYCPVIGSGKIWNDECRPAGMENVNIVVGIKRGPRGYTALGVRCRRKRGWLL